MTSLCTMDLELEEVTQWLKAKMDRARISDPSLQMLFDFNKYLTEMSRVVRDLATIVLPDLRAVVDQRLRGYKSSVPQESSCYALKQMMMGMKRAAGLVQNRTQG